MFSAKDRFILRVSALAALVGLLVFVFGLPYGSDVRAAPVLQETPGYDGPTEGAFPTQENDDGYGGPQVDTPVPPQGNPNNPLATPSPTFTPTLMMTPTPMATNTLAVDVFRTEDAQMNGSQTTPAATETAAPTNTLFPTPTATKRTAGLTTASRSRKPDGFRPDWGLFWIGFSLPVLGACGAVLYLLDRRPELFRRGK